MKTPSWKSMIIVACLLGAAPLRAQEKESPNPFAEGLTPIEYSQSEREELELYYNKQQTRLRRVLDLARATYPKSNDHDTAERIAMYEDEVIKVVPDAALDLSNFTATLLRVALNQGLYLEHQIHGMLCLSHEDKFREQQLVWSIKKAIELYETDVELFQSKKKIEEEYIRYGIAFAGFVVQNAEFLSKKEAVEYYHDASQLLLNVIQAKGDRIANNFVDEMHDLADVKEKTAPEYTGVPQGRKEKVLYARKTFQDVAASLQAKFNDYIRKQAIRGANSAQEVYFIDIAQHNGTVLASEFKIIRRVPGAYDEIGFTFVSETNKEPKKGRLICSVDPKDPAIKGGIYLEGNNNNAWSNVGPNCFDYYRSSKTENENNVSFVWPNLGDEDFMITPNYQGATIQPFRLK